MRKRNSDITRMATHRSQSVSPHLSPGSSTVFTGAASPRTPGVLRVSVSDTDEKVVINIGGSRFVTYSSTLKNIPDTVLANLNTSDKSFDVISGEYFFDRNPRYFASILDYYRTGTLHFPHCLCGPSVKTELDFWGIDENCISECCWRSYKQYFEQKATLDELEQMFAETGSKSKEPTCGSQEKCSWFYKWKNFLWRFLDKPDSSKGAQAWAIFFFVLILISIVIVVLETHPNFRTKRNGFDVEDFIKPNKTINPKLVFYYRTVPHVALQVIDGLCVVIFMIELLVRVAVCPSKLRFIKSFFNIVDIASVVPIFIVFILNSTKEDFLLQEQSIILIGYLSLSSVLRVFRLFKIARHYRSFRLLILAVKSSIKELILLLLLITMGMLIFSTLIYFAEFQVEENFKSIPIGLWWSIITMTTVGYGDVQPTSGWGFLVGSFCAVSGMLITGLPIPIIASNFNHYHLNARFAASLRSRKPACTSWKGKKNDMSPSTSDTSSRQVIRGPGKFLLNYNDEIYSMDIPNRELDPNCPTRSRRARSAFTPLDILSRPAIVKVQENGVNAGNPHIMMTPPDGNASFMNTTSDQYLRLPDNPFPFPSAISE